MGIENMRRWPVYIVLGVCILLVLSLLNSWSMETDLRFKMSEISTQLVECSKQQSTCAEGTIALQEQRDGFSVKVSDLEKQRVKLLADVSEAKQKLLNSESKVNHTLIDTELCKTELQSLKNLQLSKSVTLDTLRFEKDTLTAQLGDKKKKIEELEKEVERLRLALTTKVVLNPVVTSKVTPAVQPPKQSSALVIPPQIKEPAVDNNDANEVDEDVINDALD